MRKKLGRKIDNKSWHGRETRESDGRKTANSATGEKLGRVTEEGRWITNPGTGELLQLPETELTLPSWHLERRKNSLINQLIG